MTRGAGLFHLTLFSSPINRGFRLTVLFLFSFGIMLEITPEKEGSRNAYVITVLLRILWLQLAPALTIYETPLRV